MSCKGAVEVKSTLSTGTAAVAEATMQRMKMITATMFFICMIEK
jgi:preprotein translocase subunit SecG